jgi:hypothetical protein
MLAVGQVGEYLDGEFVVHELALLTPPVLHTAGPTVRRGNPMANSRLEERVIRAAEATLAEQSYVSPVDVLLRLGWLAPTHLDLWRQGRIESLEQMVQAGLGKQSTAMRTLRTWATRCGNANPDLREPASINIDHMFMAHPDPPGTSRRPRKSTSRSHGGCS